MLRQLLKLALYLVLTGALYGTEPATRLVRIVDGDTIVVMIAGKKRNVRVAKIDAPELSQPYGRKAMAELARLTDGDLSITVVGHDRYGRVLATVCCDQVDVGLEMVARGAAWHYKQYSQSQIYDDAQKKAQAKKIGLWESQNTTPPWEWRQHLRRSKSRK